MKDRVPRYPGRVTLTPVSGQTNTYDMARADDPTEAGTPLNTATLLTATTAQSIFGDSNDHTVNEALSALLNYANTKARAEIKTYVGTGTIGRSTPTSVTFSFTPKLVWIARDTYRGLQTYPYGTLGNRAVLYEQVLLMYGAPTTYMYSDDVGADATNVRRELTFTWNDNTVEWYNVGGYQVYGGQQLNQSGKTYYALAIG